MRWSADGQRAAAAGPRSPGWSSGRPPGPGSGWRGTSAGSACMPFGPGEVGPRVAVEELGDLLGASPTTSTAFFWRAVYVLVSASLAVGMRPGWCWNKSICVDALGPELEVGLAGVRLGREVRRLGGDLPGVDRRVERVLGVELRSRGSGTGRSRGRRCRPGPSSPRTAPTRTARAGTCRTSSGRACRAACCQVRPA